MSEHECKHENIERGDPRISYGGRVPFKCLDCGALLVDDNEEPTTKDVPVVVEGDAE